MRKADGLDQLEAENKYNKPYAAKKKEVKPLPTAAGGKIPKWKQQSLMFRQAMQASSGDKTDGPSGGNIIPSSEQFDDRIECQFCGRKFNEEAAKRH